MFVGIIGLLAAVAIPILQANDVEVNWWVSLIVYVAIIALCVWSFLRHAVPQKAKVIQAAGTVALICVLGALARYAVLKQFHRDNPTVPVVNEWTLATAVAGAARTTPKLIGQRWLDRSFGALVALLVFLAIALVRKARAAVIRIRTKSTPPSLTKGFLDYKAEAEAAMAELPRIVGDLTQIMQRVAPAIARHTRVLGRARTTEQQMDVAKATARSLDRFSDQFERVCTRYQAVGNSLSQGMEGWSKWASRSSVDKIGVRQFVENTTKFVATLATSNAMSQAYIDSMRATRGVAGILDASIDRHVRAVQTIMKINEVIRSSSDAALRRFAHLAST